MKSNKITERKAKMKYLIIGTGGTGATIGVWIARAGLDVTVIARGNHLAEIREKGLRFEKTNGETYSVKINATEMENYKETPDVIFVCVKGYSLESVIPFIRRVAGESTVVIPILNIYGTGKRLQERLPGILVTDACIYVSATIKSAGVIEVYNDSIRIFFGARSEDEYRPVLELIEADLNKAGIKAVNSHNIQRDTMEKYTFISTIGAAALYFDCEIGEIQKEGEPRELYKALIKEIVAIASAMGIKFERDLVQAILASTDRMSPNSTTSILRDVRSGHEAEIDGQIFNVVRMAKEYSVPVPSYEKVAAKLGFKE
jgi:2-dehydropantoate 2-reductase